MMVEENVVVEQGQVEAPAISLRGFAVTTDGILVTIHSQTCSNLELHQIGQSLMSLANQREKEAMDKMNKIEPKPIDK